MRYLRIYLIRCLLAAVLTVFCVFAGWAELPASYEVHRLGLTGAAFTDDSGATNSFSNHVNDAGQVIGSTVIYDGALDMGRAAWIDDGSGAVRVGLIGPGYEHANGYAYSYPRRLTPWGGVVGYSRRYTGSTQMGEAVWLDDGSGPTRLGLYSGDYQRNDGFAYSVTSRISAAGKVLGHSEHYHDAAGNAPGRSAWLDDGSGAVMLGYHGGDFIREDGRIYTEALSMNAAGQAVGVSDRYNGLFMAGQYAWRDDGSGPTRLGLVGGDYTSLAGNESSVAWSINDAGLVGGTSNVYNTTSQYVGQATWLDDGSGAVRVGLTGGVYQRDDNYAYAMLQSLSQSGTAIGYSIRYSGMNDLGVAAWKDDGTGPVALGLVGGAYEDSNGRQNARPHSINDAGQVIGYSSRYDTSPTAGHASWIDDGSGPTRLGLFDEGHTRDNGYQFSNAEFLNQAGQVAGTANRYDGSQSRGASGWFYDSAKDTNTELVFSVRDDGYASTSIGALTEDGTVFGTFREYDGADELGRRLFAWKQGAGLTELGTLLTNPDDIDWDQFISIGSLSETGYFTGLAKVLGESGTAAYLFAPLSAALLGDTDGDGDIDDSDLGTAFANYTGPGATGKTAAQCDTDADGDVDDSDLGTLFSGYTGPIATTNVPEPTAMVFMGLGALLVARRRRYLIRD